MFIIIIYAWSGYGDNGIINIYAWSEHETIIMIGIYAWSGYGTIIIIGIMMGHQLNRTPHPISHHIQSRIIPKLAWRH